MLIRWCKVWYSCNKVLIEDKVITGYSIIKTIQSLNKIHNWTDAQQPYQTFSSSFDEVFNSSSCSDSCSETIFGEWRISELFSLLLILWGLTDYY